MPNYLKQLKAPAMPNLSVKGPEIQPLDLPGKILTQQAPKQMGYLNNPYFQGGAQILNGVLGAIPSMDKSINSIDESTQQVRNSMNDALMSGTLGPWGQVAGIANSIIDKTGGYTDASKGLGKGTDTLNAMASTIIPGAGWFTKRTDKFAVDDKLSSSGGYTGTAKDATRVAGNANAKLLFGRTKANNQIADMKLKQNTVTGILDKNKAISDAVGTTSQDLAFNTQFKNSGGWQNAMFGRKGLKLSRQWAKEKLAHKNKIEAVTADEISDKSIIPEGALHAHKHHINKSDKELSKQITAKGVPVISHEMGGEIIQHAEIERGEIIFRKEITEKLEELWEDGSNEAMIEAGKLISNEIVNNTIDKSKEYEIED